MVGASDHAGWAVLITVARDAKLLDRRRVALLGEGLPCLPHHHEAQGLPQRQAEALVERVRSSAEQHAREALGALAASVSTKISGIALRRYAALPPTVAERIADYRAQTFADSAMYRDALSDAAKARGWSVHWYDPKKVFLEAARALKVASIDRRLRELGKELGPPWQKDHRLAMAAAIASLSGPV